MTAGLAAVYVTTAGRPYLHAALNPSPQLTQRSVGGGIRAMIPFQAALAARGGAPGSASPSSDSSRWPGSSRKR